MSENAPKNESDLLIYSSPIKNQNVTDRRSYSANLKDK
jgi:hypothetical protein